MTTDTTMITNAAGQRFYIERAKDFDERGNMVDGHGYFVGIADGNDWHSGEWFPTYDEAVAYTSPSAFR